MSCPLLGVDIHHHIVDGRGNLLLLGRVEEEIVDHCIGSYERGFVRNDVRGGAGPAPGAMLALIHSDDVLYR